MSRAQKQFYKQRDLNTFLRSFEPVGIIIMSLEKSNRRYFTPILISLINKVKSCKHHIYIKYSNIFSCIM